MATNRIGKVRSIRSFVRSPKGLVLVAFWDSVNMCWLPHGVMELRSYGPARGRHSSAAARCGANLLASWARALALVCELVAGREAGLRGAVTNHLRRGEA